MIDDVVITGTGVVSSIGLTTPAFFDSLCAGRTGVTADHGVDLSPTPARLLAPVREFDPGRWLTGDTVRRMSRYAQFATTAATMAAREAGLNPERPLGHRVGALCGAMVGSPTFVFDYYHPIVEKGVPAASPLLFGEGVPNAPTSHLSMSLGISGGCQTLLGNREVGLECVLLATEMVRSGRYDIVLAGAGEEYHPVVGQVFDRLRLLSPLSGESERIAPFAARPSGVVFGEGSAFVVIESAAHAEKRSARPLARIVSAQSAVGSSDPDKPETTVQDAAISAIVDSTDPERSRPPLVFSSACGLALDQVECRALARLGYDETITVTSVTGSIGECLAVTPLAALAAAVHAGQSRQCPPTLTTQPALPQGLRCPTATEEVSSDRFLILASSLESACQAVLLQRP
jgi:3-oxoacyl-[acyl-carrier-protein] synthase II